MSVYSFLDSYCSITGPGGTVNIGSGAQTAEEGITFPMEGDKNTRTMSADGSGMHSLHASNAGNVTVRLLKTSPANAALQVLYDTQRQSSALWGQNTITLNNPATGDNITASQVAFSKFPDVTYAKDGGMNEWQFMAISVDHVLGTP